jgi:hypothetical protein
MNWITKSLIGAALALTAVACGSKVLVGTDNGQGGAGGSGAAVGTTSTAGGGCTANPASPVACSNNADCAALGAVCSGGVCTCASQVRQDDIIVFGSDPVKIRLASFPLTCDDPDKGAPAAACSWYNVEVTFPAALLTPGHLPMGNPDVTLFMGTVGIPNNPMPMQCTNSASAGGGPLGGSAWEILAVDTDSVQFSVTGFQTGVLGHDINGTHTAERCAP